MPGLPTGTFTLLFTDIEGSTRLLEQLGNRYPAVLAEHRQLLRAVLKEWRGQEVDTQGDAVFAVFSRAKDSVLAGVAAQRALASHAWPGEGGHVRVRIGVHTGEPLATDTGYVGMDVHCAARICAAGHGGQILLSQTTRELVAADLPEGVRLRDLGEHRLKDLTRPQHLFQIIAADLPSEFPPLKSLDALPNNLPIQLTSFIGREREIAEVKSVLSTSRLLTLTGAGGSGKTRLALQASAEVLEEFKDGVWWVEFAAISDPTFVPQTVASALSVREQSGRPVLTAVIDFLKPKHVLLALDNCEHLVAACGQLAETLLRTCPTLKILATSREALGIQGEALWRVPTLSLPDPRRPPPLEHLTHYEAVRLFIERAVTSHKGFMVTNRNAAALVQVCHQLDGIPLAIELAAGRVKVLAVEQIAARLDDRFRLLTGGSRSALPRQHTLRAAMDWSHDLLSEKEQVFLRRLSVFAGGWTLEAAEAVCSEDGIEGPEILDLLTQLVDKSLVVVETRGAEARYRLLETVRQYGWDKLVDSGESDRLRTRHLDFFLKQADIRHAQAGAAIGQELTIAWSQRMETEHDNMRFALEWALGSVGADTALRLAVALHLFWDIRGYWTEGRKWLEQALAAASGAPSSLRAKAFHGAGLLAWYQGDNRRTVTQLEASVALHRDLEDKEGIAKSLDILGIVAYRQGDYGRAEALLEESLMLNRELGHKPPFTLYLLGIVARLRGDYEQAEARGRESLALNRELGRKGSAALTLDSLALLAHYRGDYAQAEVLGQEALALFRERADKFGTVGSLNTLALVACGQGDYRQAAALSEESLAMSRESGDKGAMARSLTTLGRVAHFQREYKQAAEYLRESLTLFREMGEKLGIIRCLCGLAYVAWAGGFPEQAARLFGAAEGLRASLGTPFPSADQLEFDRCMRDVRARLGEQEFTAAFAEGQAKTLEHAIEYALSAS